MQEIREPHTSVTPSQGTPHDLLGVVNLRGDMSVPVLDLQHLRSCPRQTTTAKGVTVMIMLGDRVLGLEWTRSPA
ncbi:MAG: chemotaxis protein CheW [Planctomycetes bacterium]|nr:chemotaxis protein CheW [Planctomycetota bacterium]